MEVCCKQASILTSDLASIYTKDSSSGCLTKYICISDKSHISIKINDSGTEVRVQQLKFNKRFANS